MEDEREDNGWFYYTFAMNDEKGRLIEISVPAQNETDARRQINQMLFTVCDYDHPKWKYWLNDCHPY